ncbi:hypothetical protein ACTJJ7_24885, partial [Phyllobacterium sp. 22229]|uniref:hypothetical protein n=1 Tax=Phyllobacterium sp. 22229 TaxID=3453895 RepID=UPI003F87F5D4
MLNLSGSRAKATGTIVVGPADQAVLAVDFGATVNEVIVNGTQSKTGDQERRGGRANVLGVGSRIDKSTVNLGGLMMVYDQATAGTVTVNSRGKLEVKAKSKVEEVTVNGEKAWNSLTGLGGIGGFADVYGAGSKIDKGTVNLGGWMKVRDQATAGTITVNSGGWLDVKDGGTAEEVTLNGEKEMDFDGIGGFADVYGAGSKIDKGTVNLGGYMKVRDQATVGTITLNNGGWLAVYDRGTAKEVTLNGEKAWDASGKGGVGSFAEVFGVGSRIDKGTINLGGRMIVHDDASAGTVTVNKGGKLEVLAKGRADNVLVHGGYASTAGDIGTATIGKDGKLDVKAGGKAGTVNLDGGFADVYDRGEITGKSTVSDGGELVVNIGGRAGDITLTGGDSAGHDSYAVVNGIAGDITLGANSTLNGFGTVDNVWVHAGGGVAPGTAQYKFAALTTTGDVTFDKGSIYSVQIANDGLRANRLEVQGQANLHGGTVKVQAEDFAGKDSQGAATPQPLSKEQSEGLLSKHFIILTAEKGVIGRFDEIKPDYNYITPTLAYTDKTVSLGFDLTETAKTEQKEKKQKLATELQQQKQAEVDRLKAEQAKVTASARASDEKAQQLADTLKQTQAAFDSLKVEYAKVTAGARASGEKAQQLAAGLQQMQAEVDRLKAEQAKVAADTTAAEAKAQQLAADEAKAQAEADRLNRQLHEEQIKNIVLVDAV